jgi:hypothetical protein
MGGRKYILVRTPLGNGELDQRQEVDVYVSTRASLTKPAKELLVGNRVLFDVRETTEPLEDHERYDDNHCIVPITSAEKIKKRESREQGGINPGNREDSFSVDTLLRDAQVATAYASYMATARIIYDGLPAAGAYKYGYHAIRILSAGCEKFNEYIGERIRKLERGRAETEGVDIRDVGISQLKNMLSLKPAEEKRIMKCIGNDAPDKMFDVDEGTTKGLVTLERRIVSALPHDIIRWFKLKDAAGIPNNQFMPVNPQKLRKLRGFTAKLRTEYRVDMDEISGRESPGDPQGGLKQFNPMRRYSPAERRAFLERHGFESLVGVDVERICSLKLG